MRPRARCQSAIESIYALENNAAKANQRNHYTVSEIARLPPEKRNAVRLAEACLARVDARERDVQAWAYIDAAHVLAQARARDAEAPRGPLHGIPLAG